MQTLPWNSLKYICASSFHFFSLFLDASKAIFFLRCNSGIISIHVEVIARRSCTSIFFRVFWVCCFGNSIHQIYWLAGNEFTASNATQWQRHHFRFFCHLYIVNVVWETLYLRWNRMQLTTNGDRLHSYFWIAPRNNNKRNQETKSGKRYRKFNSIHQKKNETRALRESNTF